MLRLRLMEKTFVSPLFCNYYVTYYIKAVTKSQSKGNGKCKYFVNLKGGEHMDIKEVMEFLDLLRSLPKEEQERFYYMIKGAAIVAETEEKRS